MDLRVLQAGCYHHTAGYCCVPSTQVPVDGWRPATIGPGGSFGQPLSRLPPALMKRGIFFIAVVLLLPVRALAGFSEAHKAYEPRDFRITANEFSPLRSDLERAVDSCTVSVRRDYPDFDAYSDGSSVILLGAIDESRYKFHKCLSKKGYPLSGKSK